MFRRTSTILDQDGVEAMKVAALDADVIMTTMVVGFSATQLQKGNPITFHAEDDEGMEKLTRAVELINGAVANVELDPKVTAERTPVWTEGAMITASHEGEKLPFEQRHAALQGTAAEAAHEVASRDKNVGYQGKGAYTGFVDDPDNNRANITATIRLNVLETWTGSRWVPPRFRYLDEQKREIGNQDTLPWGLIAGRTTLGENMGEQKFTGGGGLVAYTHGMVQAIYEAIASDAIASGGRRAIPYEIAVGEKTKKLASCLPCTLFMYAVGYPPSAIHLGRGESWMPFEPKNLGDDGYSEVFDEAVREANSAWYGKCAEFLDQGLAVLEDMTAVEESHRARFELLTKVNRTEPSWAANLLLDAVTVHSSEVDRILRTLVKV